MRCNIEYKPHGKKRKLLKGISGRPLEFPNTEKVRQFMRNHKFEYDAMRRIEIKGDQG